MTEKQAVLTELVGENLRCVRRVDRILFAYWREKDRGFFLDAPNGAQDCATFSERAVFTEADGEENEVGLSHRTVALSADITWRTRKGNFVLHVPEESTGEPPWLELPSGAKLGFGITMEGQLGAYLRQAGDIFD